MHLNRGAEERIKPGGTPSPRRRPVSRWWDHMADLMEVNPDRSPRAVELQEMFHLD
jgi:hypothetical protein